MRRTQGCTLLLCLLLALALACNKQKPAESKKTPEKTTDKTPDTPPVKKEPLKQPPLKIAPKRLTFEEMLKRTQPLAPKPGSAQLGSSTVKAELCSVEGTAFVHSSNMSVLKAITVIDNKLYVIDHLGQVHGFVIASESPCKLTIDKTFGTNGVWKLAKKMSTLSRDNAKNLYASSGIWGGVRISGGKLVACKEWKQGATVSHPSGNYALGYFVGSTVNRLVYSDTGCTTTPWVLQDLSNDAKRKGPMSSVHSIGFAGSLTLIGGSSAKKVKGWGVNKVFAFDASGKELFSVGKSEGWGPDKFGWVHAIDACGGGFCVLDGNFRQLSKWTSAGTLVGAVKLSKLFDLRYPWIPAFAQAKEGVFYFVAGQDRARIKGVKGEDVGEGLIYRVTGL